MQFKSKLFITNIVNMINKLKLIKFKIIQPIIAAVLLSIFITESANAIAIARPIGGEKRIKIINYMPNSVFKFTGHYLYQSIIEFSMNEEIQSISMGTSSPWQILPSGNRIFLKPIEDDAVTNMTVITNKRMYFFEMHAEEATGVSDESLSFIMKFVYPEENNFNAIRQMHSSGSIDLSKPELYNYDYTISGKAKGVEPVQVFDDGEFTFFKFKDVNAELPAIFYVDGKNNEGLVNFRVQNGYVVVERVSSKFTLRHGADVLCIFNENFDENAKANKKKSTKEMINQD